MHIITSLCCFSSGVLLEMEYDILTEWFQHLITSPSVHVNLFGNRSETPHLMSSVAGSYLIKFQMDCWANIQGNEMKLNRSFIVLTSE